MRPLTAWLEDGYCSITVANHQLITVIRFVSKNYTHPWKGFANRLRLVLHTCEILFSKNVREKFTVYPNTALVFLTLPSFITSIYVHAYICAHHRMDSHSCWRDSVCWRGHGSEPTTLRASSCLPFIWIDASELRCKLLASRPSGCEKKSMDFFY